MVYGIIIIAVLVGVLIVKTLLSKFPDTKEDPFSNLREEENIQDGASLQETDSAVGEQEFDKEYFERCQKGEPYQLFMKFASISDCVFLQGLLSSSQIPSHVENQHMNSLFGAGANMVSRAFAAQLWILTADYDRAYEIAVQFLVQKSKKLEESADSKLKEGLAAALVAILGTPYPITKSQQILGMTIFPKLDPENQVENGSGGE